MASIRKTDAEAGVMVERARRDGTLDDLLRYVELGAADWERLAQLGERLTPELPAIARRFYAVIADNPAVAVMLGGPGEGERLQSSLVAWMTSGLLGPHDERFVASRARLGRQHAALGVPQHYMFAAMSVMRGEYHDRIIELYPAAEARAISRSLDKLLDVELALLMRHERNRLDRVTAIQTLSAGLAHEVRNPLNAAKLQLELLERRLRRDGDDPKLVEPVELVGHELERVTRMLNEFLAFARPSAPVLGDHDIAAIVRDVAAAEQANARARDVELVADCSPRVVQVDRHKLHQILLSLVRNALDAAPAGGHVRVTATGDAAQLRFTVEDDGAGIPDAIRHRIYEPFFSTKDTGTGLGLSIAHGMVTSHGGTIACESVRPHGTRFLVTLPAQSPRMDGEPEA
jgi:signal transduction histidine kinase